MRVTFDHEPSWDMVNLVRDFDHDALPVFGQALRITDAYYGCFEADFEPSDRRPEALEGVVRRVMQESDFDDLVAKYRIITVTLFNFPGHAIQLTVDYGEAPTCGLSLPG
ncbi:hypothetical protein SAMN06265365_13525 [Tistlia consotensis]|uniref:Uncharacterized protein n=2 Tax=Tistlia TaxID=1321364 RepID=A0A1Y6CNT0_9PROT|nr:hypothetical protein [Tistlia consotensis]SMF79801.1 hypothetical protein SAMN05428998_14026 [Tistlia consotensis USBA 355]SNS16835.1 hypothetical protein SAMN06265365_13525 [Tistlia consotensis]